MYKNMVKTKQDGNRSKLTGSHRPFNSMGRPVLPPQELEQLPGLISPHHSQDRATVEASSEKGGFDGSSSHFCRYRRVQSTARYGSVSIRCSTVFFQRR